MNSVPPPQRTRLQQSLGGAWPRLEQWAANPWRRLSLLLIVLLAAFVIGNAIGTVSGARAFLDPVAALLCVVVIELAIRLRGPMRRRPSDRLGLELVDMGRLGFSYGLLLEGFKLL